MTGNNLTTKQNEVLSFLKNYIGEHKRSPYIREIQEGCGIIFYKAAVDKLVALERKGYIKRAPNKHRSIKIWAAREE
ncbi:MAG: hypothetical protein ABIH01_02825 [Candidatus Omnitrophota bacterium]